jgi:predicted ferric reductase
VVNVVFILFVPNKAINPELGLEYNVSFATVRSAHMALVNIGVAMLLITRNSILKFISGKSFDELMPLHRWHGLLGLSEVCFHVIIQL